MNDFRRISLMRYVLLNAFFPPGLFSENLSGENEIGLS